MEHTQLKEYPLLAARRGVWSEIVRYIHRDCGSVDSLLELGAGYCDFVNQYPAMNRFCVEQNIEMKKFADKAVSFHCVNGVQLPGFETDSMDLVFASNFLEHLTESEHQLLMPRIKNVLRKDGRLVLIQPNYRLCEEHYFDDETHQTIFSDINIISFLNSFGFKIEKLVPGLLPFSMKSRLPQWPILVRLYLKSPIKPMAAQMYIVATQQ